MAEYIEREAITTLFARGCGECKEACEEFDGFYADCNQCLLHGVLKEFAAIPAANVRPVVRWKWKPIDLTYGRSYYYCTACEETVDMPTIMGIPMFNFCPNCGARMEES